MSRELLQPFVNHMANEFDVYFESDDDAESAKSALLDLLRPRQEWVKFSDALPVVPEGELSVYVWLWEECCSGPWIREFTSHATPTADYWRYVDTPQPPRSET